MKTSSSLCAWFGRKTLGGLEKLKTNSIATVNWRGCLLLFREKKIIINSYHLQGTYTAAGNVLRVLCLITHWILTTSYKVHNIVKITVSQMRKLKHREGKWATPDHRAGAWQKQMSHVGDLMPDPCSWPLHSVTSHLFFPLTSSSILIFSTKWD